MNESTRISIRRIFLNLQPHRALITAAGLLGMSLPHLKREIADGTILTVRTRVRERVTREELIAAAMRVWDHAARIPRYQREMLRWLARSATPRAESPPGAPAPLPPKRLLDRSG